MAFYLFAAVSQRITEQNATLVITHIVALHSSYNPYRLATKGKQYTILMKTLQFNWKSNKQIRFSFCREKHTHTHNFCILTSWWQLVLLTPNFGRGWLSRRCHPPAVWWWCIYSLCLSFHSITRGQIIIGLKTEDVFASSCWVQPDFPVTTAEDHGQSWRTHGVMDLPPSSWESDGGKHVMLIL